MRIRKNIKGYCRLFVGLASLLILLNSCFYEHPEEEIGVESSVKVTVHYSLAGTLAGQTSSNTEYSGYQRRIVADVYRDRTLMDRQIVYREVTEEDGATGTLELSLQARDCRLVIWSDYVEVGSERDLFYDITTLVPVVNTLPYVGNTDCKDVQYASLPLDLSAYAGGADYRLTVETSLNHAAGRYELIADDVSRFLRKVAKNEITGNRFQVTVRYAGSFFTGFNALDGVAKNALSDVGYSSSFVLQDIPEGDELPLALDYVFVPGDEAYIPVVVEVKDAGGKLIAGTHIRLRVMCGASCQIRSNFLTSDPSGGIGVDDEYDGEIHDDIVIG